MRTISLPALTLLAVSLAFSGCAGKRTSDTVVYAAEFFPDENGLPRKGEPQYELPVIIIETTDADGNTIMKAYPPPPPGSKTADFNPEAATPVSLVGNFDAKSDSYYMVDMSDHPLAHTNPHRAYSPYRNAQNAYEEVDPGVRSNNWGYIKYNYDPRAEKTYRVIPQEAPCWRCGGSGIMTTYGKEEGCPEGDADNFQTYYGVRLLEEPTDNDAGTSKMRKSKPLPRN